MVDIQKKIEEDGARKCEYCDIITRPESEPLISNQLLNFWSPIGSVPVRWEKMDVGLCSMKENFDRFDRMERHVGSIEIIVPINGDLFTPVAPPGDTPDPEKIRIIPVHVGEIIKLDSGVWHFSSGHLQHVSLNTPLDYFVFLKSDTPTDDMEIVELPQAVRIIR
jgi:ureidoglycolate hydrolase